MRVTITSIDKGNPRDIGGSTGYPVMFHCGFVEGFATLVSPQDIKAGVSIAVETGQEGLSDLEILSGTTSSLMKPLRISGSYEVFGRVSFEAEQKVFYIDVNGFTFVLTVEDTKGVALKTNQWVSFVIHGLVLYDENI